MKNSNIAKEGATSGHSSMFSGMATVLVIGAVGFIWDLFDYVMDLILMVFIPSIFHAAHSRSRNSMLKG